MKYWGRSFCILALALAVGVFFGGYSFAAQKSTKSKGAEQEKEQAAGSLDPAYDVAASVRSGSPQPLMQLLQSVGRDVNKVQPEEGFELYVPPQVVVGDPFIVRLAGKGLKQVKVTWRNKTLTVAPTNNILPVSEMAFAVPLDAKAKMLPLTIVSEWETHTETMYAQVPVVTRAFPVQSLKVDRKYVDPPQAVQDQIKRDRAAMKVALSGVTPVKYWSTQMLRPSPGGITSEFGLRRVFNGKERNPHKGLDFDGEKGDPIKAVASGTVVLAEEQYYGGNTVVIDHGLGVFSLYLHLSAFKVTAGQSITAGDILGLIGSTGRVTGPHLHYSFSVLGDSVNPAVFLMPAVQ